MIQTHRLVINTLLRLPGGAFIPRVGKWVRQIYVILHPTSPQNEGAIGATRDGIEPAFVILAGEPEVHLSVDTHGKAR